MMGFLKEKRGAYRRANIVPLLVGAAVSIGTNMLSKKLSEKDSVSHSENATAGHERAFAEQQRMSSVSQSENAIAPQQVQAPPPAAAQENPLAKAFKDGVKEGIGLAMEAQQTQENQGNKLQAVG